VKTATFLKKPTTAKPTVPYSW